MAEKSKQPAAKKGGDEKVSKKSSGGPRGGGSIGPTSDTLPQVTSQLIGRYKEKIIPQMMKDFNYTSVMQVPRLEKIVINMGVGIDDKQMDGAVRDMTLISGQKPVVTRAKKAISNFRLRQGMKVGCKVTLRGPRMWHFYDKLVNMVLPRQRDFQGLSPKSFDGRGNYALGLKEQLIFPEIVYDQIDRMRGMDIIICTSAKNDEEARAFLKNMGLPIKDK